MERFSLKVPSLRQGFLVGCLLIGLLGIALGAEVDRIFADGGQLGFPGTLNAQHSFAATHLGLKPPHLFPHPDLKAAVQDAVQGDYPFAERRSSAQKDPEDLVITVPLGDQTEDDANETTSSAPSPDLVLDADLAAALIAAARAPVPAIGDQALVAYQNALLSAIDDDDSAAAVPTIAEPSSASGGGSPGPPDEGQAAPPMNGPSGAKGAAAGIFEAPWVVASTPTQAAADKDALPFASFAAHKGPFMSTAGEARQAGPLATRPLGPLGTVFAAQGARGSALAPSTALPVPQDPPEGGLLPLPAVPQPRSPTAANGQATASPVAPNGQAAAPTPTSSLTPALVQPITATSAAVAPKASLVVPLEAVVAPSATAEQEEQAWGAAGGSSSTPGLAGGQGYKQSAPAVEYTDNEVDAAAFADGASMPATSPDGMPDPGVGPPVLALPEGGAAAESPYGTYVRSHTVRLPDGGTQTVTVTTSHPRNGNGGNPATGLASFAQGISSGAKVVSSTLEQAAKTVSTDMPSVVSFAASTAQSVLKSLQRVENSVRKASSTVADSIHSLPSAVATPFSASAPDMAAEYDGGEAGEWAASPASPAPLNGETGAGPDGESASFLERPPRDAGSGNGLEDLAHMAEKGVQRVAANIGASNDDSGPVLGNVDGNATR